VESASALIGMHGAGAFDRDLPVRRGTRGPGRPAGTNSRGHRTVGRPQSVKRFAELQAAPAPRSATATRSGARRRAGITSTPQPRPRAAASGRQLLASQVYTRITFHTGHYPREEQTALFGTGTVTPQPKNGSRHCPQKDHPNKPPGRPDDFPPWFEGVPNQVLHSLSRREADRALTFQTFTVVSRHRGRTSGKQYENQ